MRALRELSSRLMRVDVRAIDEIQHHRLLMDAIEMLEAIANALEDPTATGEVAGEQK